MAVDVAARPPPEPLRVVRCVRCHEPLFHARGLADIEVVCHKRDCKRWQRIRLRDETPRPAGR